jgi:hypothetical protein
MGTKLNWKNLTELHERLLKEGFSNVTPLVIGFSLANGQRRRSQIRFGSFMSFVWSVSEIDSAITSLLIESSSGSVLFKYESAGDATEKVHYGGHDRLFRNWSSMRESDKQTVLRLILSQIEAYAK